MTKPYSFIEIQIDLLTREETILRREAEAKRIEAVAIMRSRIGLENALEKQKKVDAEANPNVPEAVR